MGYIPPIKDEQPSIYASRQTATSPMIVAPTPAERMELFESLKDRSKRRNFFERNVSKKRLEKMAKEQGKGDVFDKLV